MKTIFIIPRELEYLERLVELARKRKDVKNHNNQITIVYQALVIRRVNVNRKHRNKTLHLGVEINQALIKGLNTGISMSIMAISVVKELDIMHLMTGHEIYKTTYEIVT
jgi:hypothetical protein